MKLYYLAIGIGVLVVGIILGLTISVVRELAPVESADYHTAVPPDEGMFGGDASQCQRQAGVRGVIVNHHLLADRLMEDVFCQLRTDEVITVYLISPNHFWIGRGQLTTTAGIWRTPWGEIESDITAITGVQAAGVVVDERPFAREHGISNVMPLVAKYLPQARVVPIIVKDTISERERQGLIDWITAHSGEHDLIIASLDFSHYLTSDEADQADELSMAIVRALDYTRVDELNPLGEPDHVDSKPSLDILLRIMTGLGATNFQLLEHTNSAKLTGQLNTPETTSYITGYYYRN